MARLAPPTPLPPPLAAGGSLDGSVVPGSPAGAFVDGPYMPPHPPSVTQISVTKVGAVDRMRIDMIEGLHQNVGSVPLDELIERLRSGLHPDEQKRLAIQSLQPLRTITGPVRAMEQAVHVLLRNCEQATDMFGVQMQPGEKIAFGVASANRDESKYDDPHHFHLDRPNWREHFAFGPTPLKVRVRRRSGPAAAGR